MVLCLLLRYFLRLWFSSFYPGLGAAEYLLRRYSTVLRVLFLLLMDDSTKAPFQNTTAAVATLRPTDRACRNPGQAVPQPYCVCGAMQGALPSPHRQEEEEGVCVCVCVRVQ